ncbi:MAG: hypothetical protein M5U34_21675 [Chloroflexi bacterium]|nr:hypothetical protein [Chloroflexota bacterium]
MAAAQTAVSGQTIIAMQQLARQIPVPSNVVDFVSRLIVATHPGIVPRRWLIATCVTAPVHAGRKRWCWARRLPPYWLAG